jgi:branched-chain amino acid transport system ATP-binding protein
MENLRMGAYPSERKAKHHQRLGLHLRNLSTLEGARKSRQREPSVAANSRCWPSARALMSKPKCLMLDEPSLGIAPILVQTIFEKIVEINRELGLTILLVEQNANLALEVSHRGYVLETGRIILSDTAAALRTNPQVRECYLGGG